jgi:hypothetical protein
MHHALVAWPVALVWPEYPNTPRQRVAMDSAIEVTCIVYEKGNMISSLVCSNK